MSNGGQRIVSGLCETVELEEVVYETIEFARDVLRGYCARGGRRQLGNGFCSTLLINAGQAMPEGGVVDVAGRSDGDRVEIVVADSGHGIPLEILPHIFKPRFSSRPAGSGMGLHVVHSIVHRHGGAICAATGAAARERSSIFGLRRGAG